MNTINLLHNDALSVIFNHLNSDLVNDWPQTLTTWHRVMLVSKRWYQVQKNNLINLAREFPEEIDELCEHLQFNADDNFNNQIHSFRKFILFIGNGLQEIARKHTSIATLELIGNCCRDLKRLQFYMLIDSTRTMTRVFKKHLSNLSQLFFEAALQLPYLTEFIISKNLFNIQSPSYTKLANQFRIRSKASLYRYESGNSVHKTAVSSFPACFRFTKKSDS